MRTSNTCARKIKIVKIAEVLEIELHKENAKLKGHADSPARAGVHWTPVRSRQPRRRNSFDMQNTEQLKATFKRKSRTKRTHNR